MKDHCNSVVAGTALAIALGMISHGAMALPSTYGEVSRGEFSRIQKNSITGYRVVSQSRDGVEFDVDYQFTGSYPTGLTIGGWLYEGGTAFGGSRSTPIPNQSSGTVRFRISLLDHDQSRRADEVRFWMFASGDKIAERAFPLNLNSANTASDGARATQISSGKEDACFHYGLGSGIQQIQNLGYLCEYEGGEWNADFNAHYDWCIRTSGSTQDQALERRNQSLSLCYQLKRTQGGLPSLTEPQRKEVGCRYYGLMASAQQKRNLLLNCNYEGPAWNPDYTAHYNWCKKNPESVAEREIAERKIRIEQCESSKGVSHVIFPEFKRNDTQKMMNSIQPGAGVSATPINLP
ncbi:MAG: hypothetical protein ABW117_17730 [Candidatus Sedimenticola sp. 1PA]